MGRFLIACALAATLGVLTGCAWNAYDRERMELLDYLGDEPIYICADQYCWFKPANVEITT